ncbi:hypothetical protein SELMODRAFT_405537 [Selaginella moellendorffii]|uniref:Uncharacterized protein n=1 Tax=Selaginella moellendorffii TaxID=88036 RepID=D8QYX0_SELML|nr:hypothetical protein SELMODRAFT_405537 [Selaginella moellendorffii]
MADRYSYHPARMACVVVDLATLPHGVDHAAVVLPWRSDQSQMPLTSTWRCRGSPLTYGDQGGGHRDAVGWHYEEHLVKQGERLLGHSVVILADADTWFERQQRELEMKKLKAEQDATVKAVQEAERKKLLDALEGEVEEPEEPVLGLSLTEQNSVQKSGTGGSLICKEIFLVIQC